MRIAADQVRITPQSTAQDDGTLRGTSPLPLHGGVGNRLVLFYVLLAVIVLAPGIALQAGDAGYFAPWPLLARLPSTLSDIRFGSGLRFWLGVTGTVMMGLLLLYPVRKAFAKGRGLGSIGAWFHLHIVFGIAGPVLILYHCNFGLGGTNANVALWTMLAVALSGLAGQFVYRRVSAGFYGDKTQAREHLDHIKRLLSEIDGMHPAKTRLIEDLEAFDTSLLTPRQGLIASLSRRVRIEERAHHFMREAARISSEALTTQSWTPGRHRQLHNALIGHLRAYVRVARSGAGRAFREQIWARWRLFHMPLFLIMTVAVVLHVIAVWDMDSVEPAPALPARVEESQKAQPASTPLRKSGLQQLAVRTTRVEVHSETSGETATRTEEAGRDPKPSATPAAPPASGPADINDLLAATSEAPVATNEKLIPPAPTPAKRPVAKPQVAQKPADDAYKPVARKSEPAVAMAQPKAPQPVEVIAAAPIPEPAVGGSKDDGKALYAELQKRTDDPSPIMGLGVKGRSLADQIALLKSKMKDGSFTHSEAETGFALTGQHTKADCASCHQKLLREARQPKIRQCIDCHKQDDVHRGRRPDCAQCHVPTRWSQIVRNKKR